MSILVSCQDLTKSYHARPLFEGLTFGVFERDRIGIIGSNGAGKSTLLRLLAGLEEPDTGQLATRRFLRTAYVPQVAEFPEGLTCQEAVEKAAEAAGISSSEAPLKAAMILSQIGFAAPGPVPETAVKVLSGGWRRRLSLATALVKEPDLLLLDEPTNHLDLESILWLEGFLRSAPFAWVTVSHDRYFLERTVTRIAELNRAYSNGVLVAEGTYSEFLEKRAEYFANQTALSETLANKVRREVEWLRRGPKARSTKAKYRIDEAHNLIDELADVRSRLNNKGSAKIDFSATGRQTKRLLVAENLSKNLGERSIVKNFNFVLTPGMSLALMGGNGSGKTTLLKMLKGEIEGDSGNVNHAEGLRVVYFDQNRSRLDPTQTLRRTLCEAGDSVVFRDRLIHINSWAKRFRFNPEQLDIPVGELSGGEQARTLIARLMLEPADLLLLDEPTNDLDIPTLEALEESLSDFPGALIMVSHDRFLVEAVCNVVAGLDGQGGCKLYADISQWESDLKQQSAQKAKLAREERAPATAAPAKPRESSKRLSYMEQREYDRMEAEILAAETELEERRATAEDPKVATSATRLQEAYLELKSSEEKVEKLYARWSELEAKLQN